MLTAEQEYRYNKQFERAMFDLWRKNSGETNDLWLEHLKNCIRVAISETLTDKQRQCIGLYMSGYNQQEIAEIVGIHYSGVSRHISRGLDRLLSHIKYATPATLHVETKVRKYMMRLYI